MLYFYYQKETVPGFDTEYLEVVGVVLGGQKLSVAEFLADPDNFSKASAEGMEIKLLWLPGENIPRLVLRNYKQDNPNFVRVDDVLEAVQAFFNKETFKIDSSNLEKLKIVIQKRYPNDFNDRILFCYDFCRYCAANEFDMVLNVGADCIEDTDYFATTNNQLRKHNESLSSVFRSISAADNVTLYQESPESKLFIEIPTRVAVYVADERELSAMIPSSQAVCTPYSDKNAYLSNYKELGVPRHLIPMIEGNADNNMLPIQDNEKDYYGALMDWIAYNVKQEFGADTPGADDGTATIDAVSQAYLEELADRIYSWHWSHNRNMPLNFRDDADDSSDDDDSSSSSTISSKYEFGLQDDVDPDSMVIINAVIVLNSFLEEASTKLGYKVYAEAIVKLARWGSRKPTALVLDGYDVQLNLGTNTVSANIGSISDYSVVEVDGCKERITGMVCIVDKPSDSTVSNDITSIPVGIVTTSTYVNGDKQLEVPMYYPAWDVVGMINRDEIKISGISKDGITVDSSELKMHNLRELMGLYDSNVDNYLQNPFYRSAAFKDLCIEFDVNMNGSAQNLMSVFQEAIGMSDLVRSFERYKVSSVSDVEKLILDGVAFSTSSILTVNLARVLIKPMEKAQKAYAEGTSWFESWSKALEGWGGLTEVYQSDEQREVMVNRAVGGESVAQSAAHAAAQPTTQLMGAFGATSAQETLASSLVAQPVAPTPVQAASAPTPVQSAPVQSSGNPLLRQIPAGPIRPLVDDDGTIIGGYAKESFRHPNGKASSKFTLFSRATWDAMDPSRKVDAVMPIYKLYPYFLDDLMRIAADNTEAMKVYFDSPDTVYELTMYFKSVADKKSAAAKA